MYKSKNELSTALVNDRVYEFHESDIEAALMIAQIVGDKKDWRVVLVAEIKDRNCPINKWDKLLEETGTKYNG
jgi:hypothetical protein